MVTIEEAADFAFSRHCLRTVDASPSSRKSGYTWAMAKERQRKVGFGSLRHHLMSESDQAVSVPGGDSASGFRLEGVPLRRLQSTLDISFAVILLNVP